MHIVLLVQQTGNLFFHHVTGDDSNQKQEKGFNPTGLVISLWDLCEVAFLELTRFFFP